MTVDDASIGSASADALYRGLTDAREGATRVGVVRRPSRTVRAVVDENRPDLGPPESLVDEFAAARDDLKMQGFCAEGAHNAAWESVSFDRRYGAYLDDSAAAQADLDELRERLDAGETLLLVGEYGGNKRTYRPLLRERLDR